ncbi:hypothetical protein ABID82_004274 [Methylobacterium sp. PvP062]|uniref:Uncharacterized protein n=1 Tax=Methylobacterium radiotolerans TaxID=31998 RepID=A0ABV2NL58_9HYPH|nr:MULTISPECIES: hypothetical protein [unclassified Methylobacterium]KZC01438.1 hypothetical protein AU375_02362 [Methylobacterium radiotolerans]MBP2496036.1 hypothetical protein [Methylobacterium sp. PvP105]MBP2504093.1 hypothetical protein [Methylobacterium sp. PvP109]MCX7333116.1 hypothetical protein [Hyphomicrobiales bacterium]
MTPRQRYLLTQDDERTLRMTAILNGTVHPWIGRLLAPRDYTESVRATVILGEQSKELRRLRAEVGDQAFKQIALDEIAARIVALADVMADGGGR